MLAVVHDLAEAQVGDITPDEGFSKQEKKRLEEVSTGGVYFSYIFIIGQLPGCYEQFRIGNAP
jgi:hypothetical protein